jgi:hypothetical protein
VADGIVRRLEEHAGRAVLRADDLLQQRLEADRLARRRTRRQQPIEADLERGGGEDLRRPVGREGLVDELAFGGGGRGREDVDDMDGRCVDRLLARGACVAAGQADEDGRGDQLSE